MATTKTLKTFQITQTFRLSLLPDEERARGEALSLILCSFFSRNIDAETGFLTERA